MTVELVEEILSRHGRIDGLVNDGGGFSRKSLLSIGTEGLDIAIRGTLTSGFSMMRELFVRWMAAATKRRFSASDSLVRFPEAL